MQQDLKLAPFGLFNPIIDHYDFLPLFFLNLKKNNPQPYPFTSISKSFKFTKFWILFGYETLARYQCKKKYINQINNKKLGQ